MKIEIEVFPNSKKKKVEFETDKKWKIFIREKPENNKANNKIIKIISEATGIDLKKVKIISGHKKSKKIIKINNK